MAEPLISVRDVNIWVPSIHQRGRTLIVRHLELDIFPGERLGLVGESGCGKSTSLLGILGLLPGGSRISGSIRFQGRELLTQGLPGLASLRGAGVALVPQSAMSAMNPVLTVRRQIIEALPPGERRDRGQARRRCMELLDQVALPADVQRRYPHELSGGMRQRVGIAMALASRPRLLLADEATTALDTVVQARVMELLDRLCAELGLAVIFSTHDLALAANFCSTIAVMYAGSIVERVPARRLAAAAEHPYTRMLIAAVPEPGVDRGAVVSIPGAPPRLGELGAGCSFAPRCPNATAVCQRDEPVLQQVGAAMAACHHASSQEPSNV